VIRRRGVEEALSHGGREGKILRDASGGGRG
jgi:hypothetical protein